MRICFFILLFLIAATTNFYGAESRELQEKAGLNSICIFPNIIEYTACRSLHHRSNLDRFELLTSRETSLYRLNFARRLLLKIDGASPGIKILKRRAEEIRYSVQK